MFGFVCQQGENQKGSLLQHVCNSKKKVCRSSAHEAKKVEEQCLMVILG
jgi:hypothetical protein